MSGYPRLQRPERPCPGIGIVHLGLGAFFRAHGALYVAEAMRASGGDWGIVGVSLKRPGQRDRLRPQGYAYMAVELAPGRETAQVVDVVQDVLVAPEDPAAVLAAMAQPETRIVTLTVTEKGYCHEPAARRLNFDHPDIVADLQNPGAPVSAPGFLVEALRLRRAAGHAPFTVLTCDNLPENGALVRRIVTDLARARDPALADWIGQEGRFPSTMVDRIVPALRPGDTDRVAALTGYRDESPVLHEPFRQWVVEDCFVRGARPDLPAAGVQMVEDVTPFELMKLRCLNGTHSAMAYLGFLAGYETVADVVADPAFAGFVRRLWDSEICPGLAPPPDIDFADYTAALMARYGNPAIHHLTLQIAMDGSQKLPQRLLQPIVEARDAGRAMPGLTLAVAAWMRFVWGTDEAGHPIALSDPLALKLKKVMEGVRNPEACVDALLGLPEIFPARLAGNSGFRAELVFALERLVRLGARRAVAEL
ncbi:MULTISPECIES: mannitol dehydrogenase family protein [Chelativorans]|uniref:Mannitol dehydrogenase-like protein n=1 Tax=Chelativorans sp. (strain BNC1) TaxID=266779 RepID=Q11AQ0_CHESB